MKHLVNIDGLPKKLEQVPIVGLAKLKLDKNELSSDVDLEFKQIVLSELLQCQWNRYPDADYRDIELNTASYCGLSSNQIILSPGSATIITTLLNYFAILRKKIIITQPSYSLFDYHCKAYNISYTPWLLNENLEFDLENLPQLCEHTVMIITSPNNPVGNVMDKDYLEFILRIYPKTLFVVDAVYTEFADEDITPLVNHYENLLVIRSFSKAFPVAGLRLAYLCGCNTLTKSFRKLFLKFSINTFSLVFARNVLFNNEFIRSSKQKVKEIISLRNEFKKILEKAFGPEQLQVYNSQGNFLLMYFPCKNVHDLVFNTLTKHGVSVLNTSGFPLMEQTIRVSIGTAEEVQYVYQILLGVLNKETLPYFLTPEDFS